MPVFIGESNWNALNGNEFDEIKGTMNEATTTLAFLLVCMENMRCFSRLFVDFFSAGVMLEL